MTTGDRLVSLDVFRGLTVAGMLLVNNPGTWSAIYPPLQHAAWHGWTPTDLIFPFFLFIVGVTTHLSLSARRARGADERAIRRQIVRRGALIFLLGFLLNGFPFFTWTSLAGVADPSFLERVVDRLYHWRIMGVLQRIGVAYMIAGLLTQRTTIKQQVAAIAGILIGYWCIMTLVPVPGSGLVGDAALSEPAGTIAAWMDRIVLDWSRFGLGNHNWASSGSWDPEGALSTLGAIATTMLGFLAGRWIAQGRPLADRVVALFAAGALAMLVGFMWNWSFPINKSIWTSSYVVFTAGLACVTLATIMWTADMQRVSWWTKPFVIYGMNPLVAFIGSGVMARLIYSVLKVGYDGERISLQAAIYQAVFASWLAPRNASLAFAIAFVLLWYGVLYVLYRRRIFVTV